MTANKMLPAMDIHYTDTDHEKQYYISKQRYPSDESCDAFELFICPYDKNHRITFRRWAKHIENCRKQYGGNRRPCLYNASHHISLPEWDYHVMVCPDREAIRQDIQGSNSDWKIATPVNHNPVWQRTGSIEDNWEDEIEEDAQEFNLNVDKGMPVYLTGRNYEEKIDNEFDDEFNDEFDDEFDDENESAENNSQATSSVLEEELVPERPPNWNDMSKSQRKNHKRKYDRQQQRMREENVTATDFDGEKDPTKWSEKDRQAKLDAIKAAFPTNNEKMHGMKVDYTSLLNIVCQKSKLNLPKFTECTAGARGGFAYQCQIFDKFYRSMNFCSTKKDAKRDCAMWALLFMDIKGLGSLSTTRKQPVHPRLLQSQQLRESDEIGRLMASGNFHVKKQVSSPSKQVSSPSKQVSSLSNQVTSLSNQVTSPSNQMSSPWNQVSSPSKPESQPAGSRMQMYNQQIAAETAQRKQNIQTNPSLPPPGFTSIVGGVADMSLDKDFPSLQSDSSWQKVPKKEREEVEVVETVLKL